MFDFSSHLFIRKNFVIFVFFIFLSLVNFWGSLHNPFILDDNEHYLNPKKTNASFLKYDLLPNQTFAANHGMQEYQNNWGYYRPFAHTFYRFQAQILRDNPVHYHLMCIMFFAWSIFSIFQFLLFVIKNELAAFLGACFFLLHPFQGLCVNYKSALVFSIQIILLNTAFLIFVNSKRVFNWTAYLKYIVALLCYMFALLIHELAFIFPVILFLYWVILDNKETKNLLYGWLGIIFISVVYIGLRFNYENSVVTNFALHYKLSLNEFLAAYVREMNWVFRKFIYPKDIFLQSSTWVTKGMANQWIWIFYTYAVCFISILLIFYKRSKILFFLFSLFVFGFILSMPPSKNYLGDGIIYFEPHWIFYTNIGLFGLLGCLFTFLLRNYKKFGIVALVLFVSYLSYFSFIENRLYHSSQELFKRWAEDSPNLGLPQLSICFDMVSRKEFDSAIDCFQPLTQRMRAANAYNGLGAVYFLKNDYKKAKENFEKAKDAGQWGGALRSLSFLSEAEGKNDEALKYLDEALEHDKFALDLYLSKINIYGKEKKWLKATQVLNEVRSIYPNNDNVSIMYINILFKTDVKAAVEMAWESIPQINSIDSLVSLSIVLAQNHQDELFRKAYLRAFEIDPERTKSVSKSLFMCPLSVKNKSI